MQVGGIGLSGGSSLTAAEVREMVDPIIPKAATGVPSGVADNSSQGTDPKTFEPAGHTHASKVRKAKVSVSTATYTWVYPTQFANGVSPVCNAIAQVAAGNTDLFNVQILGVPTNTQCVFQISRVSAGLLSLVLGALSINPTPAAIVLHMEAFEP